MNNPVTEMKNALEEINSGITKAEEHVNDLDAYVLLQTKAFSQTDGKRERLTGSLPQ